MPRGVVLVTVTLWVRLANSVHPADNALADRKLKDYNAGSAGLDIMDYQPWCVKVRHQNIMRKLNVCRTILYIIECLLFKYRLILLRVLKVFNEPLGHSNTER